MPTEQFTGIKQNGIVHLETVPAHSRFLRGYLWWSSLLSSCSGCPVDLTCGGVVLDTFVINQKVGGGQWNLLGTYELEKGTECTIAITAGSSSSTIADAVRFVLTDNLPNAHILFSH